MSHLRILAIASIAVLIFAAGCRKKEEAAQVASKGSYQTVDPYNDIIACLDGAHQTLYVLPEQRENVLRLLKASGSGERYIMEAAMNIHRKWVPTGFVVKNATLNQLLTVGAYFDLAQTWIPYYNQAANSDTARGELLDTMTRRGVFYRVYTNAQCAKIRDGRYTDCEAQISLADYLDSTKKAPPPKNVRIHYYPINHCVKGSASCVEALCVSELTEYYPTSNCSGAPTGTKETAFGFSCPQ